MIEAAVAGVALVVLISAVVLLSGAQSRLSHPMWLDECFAALLANDQSFRHMLSAIRGGVENNPPTFYVVLWPVARLFGGLDTVGLRVFSGLSMVVGLVGMYCVCRVYFTRLQATIGTLAVASHPMVVAQMLEARFYGAWLAATIWFTYSMLIEPADKPPVALIVIRCVLAAIVATIHWFGIAAVALVVATDLVFSAAHPKQRLVKLLPFAAAALAVLLCLPFLLGQRSGLNVITWIDPVTPLTIVRMLYRILVNPSLLALVAFAMWRLVARMSHERHEPIRLLALSPILSLLLFPVVITVFSFVVQPALLERYVIVVVAPFGALVAAAALPSPMRGGRALGAFAVLGLTIALGLEMRTNMRLSAITDWRIRNAVATTERIIAHGKRLPVVFARRFEQYPVIHERPNLSRSVALLDFDGTPDSSLMRRTLFEREMARKVNRYYPEYRLINVSELRKSGPFIVITSTNEEDELRRLLDGFEVFPQAPDVFYVTK